MKTDSRLEETQLCKHYYKCIGDKNENCLSLYPYMNEAHLSCLETNEDLFDSKKEIYTQHNGIDIEIVKQVEYGFNQKKFEEHFAKDDIQWPSNFYDFLDYYYITFTSNKDGVKRIFKKRMQFNTIEELKNYCKTITIDRLEEYPTTVIDEIPF